MELKFRRKLSMNKFGYTYLNVPAEIMKALQCEYVDLVWSDNGVLMIPAKSFVERSFLAEQN